MFAGSSSKLQQSFKCNDVNGFRPSKRGSSVDLVTTRHLETQSSVRDLKQDNSFGRFVKFKPSRFNQLSLFMPPIDECNISIPVLLKSNLFIESEDSENTFRLEQPLTLKFARDVKCFSPIRLCNCVHLSSSKVLSVSLEKEDA
jgi:hypothetical protein